jgi:DNA-binding CsgD family transcriptional regulator
MGTARFMYLSEPADRVTGVLGLLTASEREVAVLASAGLSNAEIARARHVAVRTIANQLASIYQKLEVGTRVELIALLEQA